MPKINDFTTLRFYREDDPSPRIPLAALANMEEPLINLARVTLEAFGVQSMRGAIELVASPQQGCLEIFIVPSIALPSLDVLASISSDGAQAIRKGIEDYGEPAKFIWELVFGSCSVLQLWNMATKKDDKVAPATAQQEVNYRLSETAIRNDSVVTALRRLTDAARSTGVDKVTIEITDGPELPLYEANSRRRRGLIGARARERAPFDIGHDAQSAQLQHNDQPIIGLIVGDQKTPCFACIIDGRPCLAVWRSKKNIPEWSTVEVKGRFIDPDMVDPVGWDVDEYVEQVYGVFEVIGVVTYE